MGCALCVVFVSLVFGHATVARAAAGRPSGGGSCGAYAYLGTFPSGPNLTQVQGGASVRCSVPVATQGDVTSGDPVTTVYHPDGQACIQHQNVPIRFNVVADDYHAYWTDPQTGQTDWAAFVGIDGLQAAHALYFVAPLIGSNYISVPYERRGHYENNQCVPNQPQSDPDNGWIAQMENGVYCGQQTDSQITAMPGNVCVEVQQHVPTTVSPPGFGFDIVDIQRRLQQNLQGGTIHSAPAAQGVVNVPTYFWVDGASVVDPTTWVLYVPTAPDGTGRRIVYEYILQVDAPTLTWHFGDGESQPGSGVGSAYPGGTPSAMHNYKTISQRGCHFAGGACDAGGAKYEITADVNYTVHASLVWFDGVTEHTAALPDAMQQLTVTAHPTPEDLFVGQVEGVPVG